MSKVVINLSGPDGNAFVLMSYAKQYGKQLGFSKEKIAMLQEEMRTSDYENLVSTFEMAFGDYVMLQR